MLLTTTKPKVTEDRKHLVLLCPAFSEIRQNFLEKFVSICPTLEKYIEVSDDFLKILLDPLSNFVPVDVIEGWTNPTTAYEISRNFFHAIHKKRDKLIDRLSIN